MFFVMTHSYHHASKTWWRKWCVRVIKTIKQTGLLLIRLSWPRSHPSGQKLNKFIKVNYNSCLFVFKWMQFFCSIKWNLHAIWQVSVLSGVFCLCNLQADWSFQGQKTECFGFVSFSSNLNLKEIWLTTKMQTSWNRFCLYWWSFYEELADVNFLSIS